MNVNNVIYNHLSTNLVPKKRSTSHKSSELKEVYNSMAKYNKNSPLYLLSMSEAKQARMIDIKEAATTLKDVSDIFSNSDSIIYRKKVLTSDDTSIISGSFKGGDTKGLPEEFSITVNSLATEQINTGKYLDKTELDISPGEYSFGIKTIKGITNYKLSVLSTDNNLSIQNKIIDSVNTSSNIKASLVEDGSDAAIMLASTDTGESKSTDGLHFSLVKDEASDIINNIFGLDNVKTYPTNSIFAINGDPHSSSSNNISINQVIELDFHKASDKPVTISLTNDISIMNEQIDAFLEAYNNLVDLGKDTDTRIGTRNLTNDISGIVSKHRQELRSIGIEQNDDGHLEKTTDENVTLTTKQYTELFGDVSSFKSDVDATAKRLSLDPMAYINKLIVTYPNTTNKHSHAYTQSLYSGLMYNNYA